MAKPKRKHKHVHFDDFFKPDTTTSQTAENKSTTPSTAPTHVYKGCTHKGETPVKVGEYEVYLAACRDISATALTAVDTLCPLNGDMPNLNYPHLMGVIPYQLVDMGGVPKSWEEYIDYVIGLLKEGHKILAWCSGSHGRTGTFLASLIAKLEPDIDPVDTARERHCHKAVETQAQLEAVYALKGEKVPESKKPSKQSYHSSGGYSGGYYQSGGNASWGKYSSKGYSAPQSTSVANVIEDFLKHNKLKGKVYLYG